MTAILAVLVLILFLAVDVGGSYWIAKRAGIYRWVNEQFPVRQETKFQLAFHRFAVICTCVLVVSIPIQAVVVLVAGIAAAIGVL